MPDIKTREKAAGTIKTLDRAKAGTRRIKNATVHFKDTAEKSVDTPESSPEEYASSKVSSGIERGKDTAIRQFDKQGRKSIDRTRHNYQKGKENIQKTKDNFSKAKDSIQIMHIYLKEEIENESINKWKNNNINYTCVSYSIYASG